MKSAELQNLKTFPLPIKNKSFPSLDENKTYTIALADFQTSGGDGYDMLKGLKIVGEFGTFDEILADYLNQVGMSGIEVGRITKLKDVPASDKK